MRRWLLTLPLLIGCADDVRAPACDDLTCTDWHCADPRPTAPELCTCVTPDQTYEACTIDAIGPCAELGDCSSLACGELRQDGTIDTTICVCRRGSGQRGIQCVGE